MDTLEQRILEQFNDLTSRAQATKILLAVSGGPDSTCLLHVLNRNQKKSKQKIELHIAHLNHQLRGEDADTDQEFVRKLTSQYQLPFYSHRANIKKIAQDNKMGIEEASRLKRYSFFANLLSQHGLQAVATAHTLDDQIETILMNFIRGAGPRGLAGMQSIETLPLTDKKVTILRPMLSLEKQEVLDYLNEQNMDYRTDSTNQDVDYTRNQIRHVIIPELRKINPNLFSTWERNALLFGFTSDYLELRLTGAYPSLITKRTEKSLIFELPKYRGLPDILRLSVIRQAFFDLAPANSELSLERILACDALLLSTPGNKKIELGAQITLHKKGNQFTIKNNK